jgi:Mn2+/Fe2+ NRAMP family transporter
LFLAAVCENTKMKERSIRSVILGAAFLMATSAVGPGFLTQTTHFTGKLLASFGFVILVSIILDIFAQLNIWRILTVSGKRAQDVANQTISGSGYFLAALVAFGGLAFNVGNIAGTGLGFNVLFDLPVEVGAVVSAGIAIGIFLLKDAGRAMDLFVKVLGVVMLGLIVYVMFQARPPLLEAIHRSFLPQEIDAGAIVTLVGGTVGGYITFAGAHRLIDAGLSGEDALPEVNRSAVVGILLTAMIRILLFLAALGVITAGFTIDAANPPASVFQNAAGLVGYKLFGVVMWAAAITSVVGAAYTSVSFFKTFHSSLESRSNYVVIAFIVFSAAVFLAFGRPVTVLIWAGTINGFILPVGLALVLLASRRTGVMGSYRHSIWLQAAGWTVVAVMTAFSVQTLIDELA